jgi:hypothetical protein
MHCVLYTPASDSKSNGTAAARIRSRNKNNKHLTAFQIRRLNNFVALS